MISQDSTVIVKYDKIFSAEECKKIINLVRTKWKTTTGTIGEASQQNKLYRECVIYEPNGTVPDWLRVPLFDCFLSLNDKVYNFHLSLGPLCDINMIKYNVGGHYDLHLDVGGADNKRKISFTLLLNDDYEGGKLTFPIHELEVKRGVSQKMKLAGIGDLIVFPSYIPHEVTKITSGIRYALVGWVLGTTPFI